MFMQTINLGIKSFSLPSISLEILHHTMPSFPSHPITISTKELLQPTFLEKFNSIPIPSSYVFFVVLAMFLALGPEVEDQDQGNQH